MHIFLSTISQETINEDNVVNTTDELRQLVGSTSALVDQSLMNFNVITIVVNTSSHVIDSLDTPEVMEV